jgi:hypothetical protein
MPLPTMLVIGAMKCGTSALHHYLSLHPDVSMAREKEVNFFFGPDEPPHDDESEWWRTGQWHRGLGWYADRFEEGYAVRGESSPGYTDPSHPEVAGRVARVLPDVRLVMLVRDPVQRAVSQWAHHVRDGDEPRPVEEAVLDPTSQYLPRSRYYASLRPFLSRFPREQLLVVVQERLLADRRAELARVFAHVGADPSFWTPELEPRVHVGDRPVEVPVGLRAAFLERVGDDVTRLRELLHDDLPEWG